MIAGFGLTFLVAILQAIGVSGSVPAGVDATASSGAALWLPADESADGGRHECVLTAGTRWSCPSVPAGESGVVIVAGDGVIGYVVLGPTGVLASGVAEWGRLVRVAPAGVSVESPGDLRISSWVVDRPAGRPNTQKLDVIPSTAFQIVNVSRTSYWVSGPFPSPDAFLRLDGTAIARHDSPMLRVAGGPPDSPFVVEATTGVSIVGRVETRSGEPVEGALIELFARAPGSDDPVDEKSSASVPVVRLATAVADGEGQFEFSGLENGSYQVTATAFSRGRRARWTTTASAPLLMTLEPPATVTGRVVRQQLPAAGVKVRFVPANTAWRNSSDPSAHLTADVATDDSGRFELPLPPQPSGDVQFVAPDGASTRMALPALSDLSEIALGDVALPEPIAVVIRADVAGCRMTAIGPSGALGFARVAGRATSTIYRFDVPEPGEWFLDAECSGQHVSLQPPAIHVKSAPLPASFDVHVVTEDATRPSR
jgi:Carboxypeptidase regulatory-like domain